MDEPGPFPTGAKSFRRLVNHPAHMIGNYANNAGQQRMFCQYGRQVSHAAQHGQAVNLRALFGQVVDITNGPETRRVYAVAHHGGMAPGPEYHQIAHQGLSLQTSVSVRYLAIPTVRRPCRRNWPFRYFAPSVL